MELSKYKLEVLTQKP